MSQWQAQLPVLFSILLVFPSSFLFYSRSKHSTIKQYVHNCLIGASFISLLQLLHFVTLIPFALCILGQWCYWIWLHSLWGSKNRNRATTDGTVNTTSTTIFWASTWQDQFFGYKHAALEVFIDQIMSNNWWIYD